LNFLHLSPSIIRRKTRKIRVKIEQRQPTLAFASLKIPISERSRENARLLSEIKKNDTIHFLRATDTQETILRRLSRLDFHRRSFSRVYATEIRAQRNYTGFNLLSFSSPSFLTCMLRTLLISVRVISIVHAVPERNTRDAHNATSRDPLCMSPRAYTRNKMHSS